MLGMFISIISSPHNLPAFPPHSCTLSHTSPQANLSNLRQGTTIPCCPGLICVLDFVPVLFLTDLGSLL